MDNENVLSPDVLVDFDRDLPVREFLDLGIAQPDSKIITYLVGQRKIGIPADDFNILIHDDSAICSYKLLYNPTPRDIVYITRRRGGVHETQRRTHFLGWGGLVYER